MLAPVGASKGFKDTESIAGFGGYVVDVGGEGELGVEGDTQNSGGPVERKGEGAVGEGDVRVVVVLGSVGVKRVTDDFGADRSRRLSPTQSTTSEAWEVKTSAASWSLGEEAAAVKSSA